jgi:hypothetical protein
MNAAVIHSHCYQPPREDPFTGLVPVEKSAAPFNDWNERITAESYRPLTAARDNASGARINLFEWMSFNLAPTLGAWLERYAPSVLDAMIAGDKASVGRLGAGNAIATSFNHVILPLASAHERAKEIGWGIEDFQRRFGRDPRGFWCPETAMDDATAQALADAGLTFAIVAPWQVRDIGGEGQPVRWHGQHGKTLMLAPYHGELSGSIGFGDMAQHGERLAGSLRAIAAQRGIASIATDGETFGHHKRHGEMAVAAAVTLLNHEGETHLTNFDAIIASRTDWRDGKLVSPSSWSCSHGIERWRSNCGCGATNESGHNQHWRGPLRNALRWLAEMLDADDGTAAELTPRRRARYAMFASCGWFFDKLEGHESRILLRMAAFAMAGRRNVRELEQGFADRLRDARAVDHALGNGADIWYRDYHHLVTDGTASSGYAG